MRTGKFIVIEGLEGAGKTTAINTISDYLKTKNIDFILTREPGGTALGEQLRKIPKEPKFAEPLDMRSELLMFYAARTQLLEQVIRPALEKGIWVVADRFELSTYAYQGGGRGISFEFIDALSKFCVGDLQPDLVLFLDIEPELGLARAAQRSQKDRIEAESLAFFKRVYEAYQERVAKFDSYKIISASKPLEEVQDALRQQLDIFTHE